MSLKRKDSTVQGGLRVAANDPHLVSLGGGRLSTAVTIHNIPIGSMTIGSSPNCSILLKGSGVQSHHCTLHRNGNGEVSIVPENEARVLIDGNRITLETSLTQGAMITVGNSNYLRFNNPAEAQMIKSVIGSNERISMAQIDFVQDHCQNNCSFNKGGILNNALKSLTKPYDTHVKQNKSNNETISEKISKIEYININNFHSPKVFTADSITVNTPAKDVLGSKYANFTKNLSTNHKVDKDFCIKNNEINYNTKTSNSSTSFSQSSYNEILTKIKNNNKDICNSASSSPFRNQNEMITAVYDRYPKIDSNFQLFPLNSVNSEINSITTDSIKTQKCDQQQQKLITAQEQENLEEILKICTEYDRQQQNHSNINNSNSIQSSPIVQNRIKTNGSLPRDKKSSFLDLNSQTKVFFPAAATHTMAQYPIKIGNNSNYENVRIGDRCVEISPSNFHHNFHKSSNSYENVIIGKYTPQSPRTKIRTTCTSPQIKRDISYLSQPFNATHNILSQSASEQLLPMTTDISSQGPHHYNLHNQSDNDYCRLIQTFEDKLKMGIHALQGCTKNYNPISMNSTNIGTDSLRKRQNLNINNLTLNLNLVKNNNSNDMNPLNVGKSGKLIEREKDGIDNKKCIDEIDKGNVLIKIRKLKTQIADIQRQEDEVIRELDLEKALVNAEMSTVSVSLIEMENTSKSLQSKIHRLEAQRNANRVMQETQQAKLKQSIEMKQEHVTNLQKMLKKKEYDLSLKEEYEKELESLENDRKIFEDLEFQYLEEETDWMAYRDELHNDLKNLIREIENRQLQIIHLQTQGFENQNSACIDIKALQNNLLSLLKELEKSREELQVIDKVIFKTNGEQQKVIEQQNYSDSDDDEIDFKKNKNGVVSQSFFGSTEVLSAKSKESTNVLSRSINENMFFNNNMEMPIKTAQNNKFKEGITIYEITELNGSNEDSMNKITKDNDKKIEIIPEIVRRVHKNDEKDPILKLKYNVKARNDETPKVNLNLSLESDDFEVNTLDKKVPSQDIDRICKVTLAAPISTTIGASGKIFESIKEIERNRQLLLAQQGSYVIEHERQKLIELKKKCHNEARAQYLSSHSIAEQNNSRNESKSEDISSVLEEKQNLTVDKNTILSVFGKFDNYCSQQELQQHKIGQQHRHSYPELEFQRSRPLSDVNSKMNCENLKQKQFKSNNDLRVSSISIATASIRLSENSEDTKRSSFNSNIVLGFEKSISQNNNRVISKHQRPLTRYLPIMSSDLDLQQHIESAGHQIALCPHVIIDSYSCRGYLHKLGATFRGWSRRWFVLDRKKSAFIYYSDRLERKPRGGAYFSTIEEVYLDHLNTSKSGRPYCTFIVKTRRRSYHLQAASDATARIWIDAIITGAQGNIGY